MLVRQRIHSYTKRYAHFIPTIALISGLIFDLFTLHRPDELFENVSMLGYLLLCASIVLLLQLPRILENERKRIILLSILQFGFGHLTGVLMILYARSGTLAGSAIFVAMLGALFLGNEVLKDRYARNTLRVGLLFFLLLTYSALVIPVLVHHIGVIVFGGSVLISIALMYIFLRLLAFVMHVSFSEYIAHLRFIVIGIAIIFSLLYLFNFIPPVPLATKHIGIYHNVTKISDGYVLEYEPPLWYMFWRDTNTKVHIKQGSPVYCFSSIFAPENLTTDIYHSWDYFNKEHKRWEHVSRIPFQIQGGRTKGYRGYTHIKNLATGQWRCRSETKRGAALGQILFTIIYSNEPPPTRIKQL